jgi:threonine/homoserine/homoserine lactone efflux protein
MFFLVVRRTLARGLRSGVWSGLGVATADGIYAAVAAFGVAAVSGFVLAESRWLRLAGGMVLIALGVRGLAAKPLPRERGRIQGGGDYLSSLLLTLANPPTILSFAALAAGLGLTARSGYATTALLVAGGVCLGSAAWWLLLAALVSRARARFGDTAVRRLGLLSSAALILFGVATAGAALAGR